MSSDIARAYLAWNEKVRATEPTKADEIVIDNLSGVRVPTAPLPETEVLKILDPGTTRGNTRAKLEQSAAYRTVRSQKPTLENLAATGSLIVDVTDADLAELRAFASPVALELPEIDVVKFTRAVGDQGLRALEELYGQGAPLDWRVVLGEPGQTFNAKVVTDGDGGLLCALPRDAVASARLATTILHEVAGHVYHFAHLRRNESLRAREPHLLCVCLHTHEGCFVEGIAQLLVLLALERGAGIEHAREYRALNYGWTLTMALAHANLTAMLRGERSLEQAIEFHLQQDTSARWKPEALHGMYTSSANDYFECKTTLSYFASYKIIRPLLKKSDAELRALMPELLSTYFTPADLQKFVALHG